MTALERIAHILEVARIDGGWIDEAVAATILVALGLNADGEPVVRGGGAGSAHTPTSSNIEHG